MAFIEVTDFRLETKGTEQPPPAEAEHQLLLQPQLRTAPVQLTGNAAMRGVIRCVIAIQQVQLDAADLDLPGAQPDRVARKTIFRATTRHSLSAKG